MHWDRYTPLTTIKQMTAHLSFVEGHLVLLHSWFLYDLIEEAYHFLQVFCQALKPCTACELIDPQHARHVML